MSKKKSRKHVPSASTQRESAARTSLPEELNERLKVVWRRLGHLIDWCQNGEAWMQSFCQETRPYRATFYWEAMAEIVSSYMIEHPNASPEDVLSDCLVATQCSPSEDDPDRLTEFREMWQEILDSSRKEIEEFIQADLEIAKLEGTYEAVARMYVADYGKWNMAEE